MIPWHELVLGGIAVVASVIAADQFLSKRDVARELDAQSEDLITARRTIAELADQVAMLRANVLRKIGGQVRQEAACGYGEEAAQKPVGTADGDFRYDVPSDTLEPAVAAPSPNARVIHASDPAIRDVNGFFEQRERARAGIAPRDGKGKFCRVSAPVSVDRINRPDAKGGWS